MPEFRYRALTHIGEVVEGSITAPSVAEVNSRIEYLGLIPIEAVSEQSAAQVRRGGGFSFFSAPKSEDITVFTQDLSLLLRTGARINEALELLSGDADIGRMRPVIAKVTTAILSGESFAEAISHHPAVFPQIYVALVKVGEASGSLAPILEALGAERQRAEALRRKISDTLRYPGFLLLAAGGVLLFFLIFVLPQFAGVFKDFNAKPDPVLLTFLNISDFLRGNARALLAAAAAAIAGGWLALRQPKVKIGLMEAASRLPIAGPVMGFGRTTMFCRNLGLLLASGVTLPMSLRILADMMTAAGGSKVWSEIVDTVRQGGKLSDALATTRALPPMALRTLRLGEDSGQLPALAARVAEFYQVKQQRSLDRVIGIIGPVAIVVISVIVGGLIVSVMTALLSVNQVIN